MDNYLTRMAVAPLESCLTSKESRAVRRGAAGKVPAKVTRWRPTLCAPRDAVLNPWRSREELGGMFLGHRVHLRAKAGGDKSMPEKRGSLEDARGAAPQGPRDRAKAGLP